MDYPSEQWQQVLDLMHEEVTDYQYNTWFKNMQPIFVGDDQIFIQFENRFIMNIMKASYQIMMENAAKIAFGRRFDVQFVLKGTVPQPQEPEEPAPDDGMFNPKYTFDTFVVGAGNRFAHAASMAVAQTPAAAYNPLFLYGGAGLGKTHLMHAIGHHIRRTNKDARVLYITSEHFTNQLINAITERTSQELRDRLRTVDVLMVDDIQFIAGKTATQEEFFHTFNELHTSGRQIVISSDRPPREIPTLEERLRSRFEWGLIADIQKPDYETRIAILHKKAEMERLNVPEEVFTYIAEKVDSNIRELEGSLTRVNAMAQLSGGVITLNMARDALEHIMPASEKAALTPEEIIRQVAQYFSLSQGDILSQRRSREITRARQIAMYLIREETQLSTTRIGDMFGGRDHTTVMHACDKIAELKNTDDEIRRAIEQLT